ncbi:hypothetical protein Tco_0261662 [Tanacetum coccineum]
MWRCTRYNSKRIWTGDGQEVMIRFIPGIATLLFGYTLKIYASLADNCEVSYGSPIGQADQELLQDLREIFKRSVNRRKVSRKEFDGFVQNYYMHSLGKTVKRVALLC